MGHSWHEKVREGVCGQCGGPPQGKYLTCDKCRWRRREKHGLGRMRSPARIERELAEVNSLRMACDMRPLTLEKYLRNRESWI